MHCGEKTHCTDLNIHKKKSHPSCKMHQYKQGGKNVVMPVPLINTRGQASTTNAKWILNYAKHQAGEKVKINT